MIAVLLAASLAQTTPEAAPRTGEWVVLDVQRVIAPEQTRGQCFVQGRVARVVLGRRYKEGQQLAISVACVQSGSQLIPLQATREPPRRPPITVQRLEALKKALVHLDDQQRVVDNEYYAVGVQPLR